MKASIALGIAVIAPLVLVSPAQASGLILTGNYLQVSVNDQSGTFGQGGGTRPAFVHDPTGSRTFDLSTDYIAPGAPHDGFSLISDQFTFRQNDNQGPVNITALGPATLLTGAAARGYANAATWSGTLAGFFTLTNSYFFNNGDERVLIETTITALSDLTNLAFARSVDPDSGTTVSINQRGNASFGINDFIGSESTANGRTLALVNIDANGFERTTQINGSCCSNINPYTVLSHAGDDRGLSSTGDHGLNLAYRIGSLGTGSSASFQYAYAAGLGLDDIVVPGAVPEPSTWAMLILGMGIVGGAMRRRKQTVRLTFA